MRFDPGVAVKAIAKMFVSVGLVALIACAGQSSSNAGNETPITPDANTPATPVDQAVTIAPGAIRINLDWTQTTGKQASSRGYGLNLYKILEPKWAQDLNYRTNLAAMKLGMVRVHRGDQMVDSSTNAAGWVIDPDEATYRWDKSKITTALEHLKSFGGERMINITNFPAFLKKPGTQQLEPSKYQEYANFCADLVKIVNTDLKLDVRYWEITNELDDGKTDGTDKYNGNMLEVGKMFNTVSSAIKALDPSLKVGGPAMAQVGSDNYRDEKAFLGETKDTLDFFSYHTYFTGDQSLPLQKLYDSASGMGWATQGIQAQIKAVTGRSIETFHDEYNISWAPPDPRMTNEIGAVFDALALKALANAGASGGMAWNESDGWYGKLENEWGKPSFSRRPSSFVFELYNTFMAGEIVLATSSDAQKLDVFAVKNSASASVSIVNRSGSDQTVSVAFGGTKNTSNLEVKQVTATGLKTSSLTPRAVLDGTLVLPKDSITLLTRGH
jgi:Glycosyl hydrolases family 39